MLKKVFRVLCLLLVCSALPLWADGMIFPVDPENREMFIRRPRPMDTSGVVPLSVTYHKVSVDIKEAAASTKVDQAFYNHEPRTVEGVYIFPLPVGASISGFAMDIEGRMTKGELMDSDKARQIYEDIVRSMKDPGLLEFMGTGLFKTRIYPIEGLKEKKVKLEYQEALRVEGNLIRYVYPLNIEKYLQEPMKSVNIDVTIQSKAPITTVYSPTHKVAVKKTDDNHYTVSFESEKMRPDKDFVLYYAVAKKDLSISTIFNRSDTTEDGTFMVMLSPRPDLQEKATMKKNIALVFDTSGSMAGDKIEQARRALEFCVKAMKQGDGFHLVLFSSDVNPYKPEVLDFNNEVRENALQYIKGMEPAGGTNISEALVSSLKALQKKGADTPAYIFFMTDGAPTLGTIETNDLLKEVKAANPMKARLFVFGVGDTVNTQLLDRLAEENGGTAEYVSEKEDIEEKVSSLFSKMSYPAMTDVELSVQNVDVNQVYPQKIPDLFKGSSLMVLGRYKKGGEALVRLTGKIGGEPVKFDYEASFPERENENGFVSRIWATRKIGYLLDQIRKSGDSEEVRTEIVKLAKRFGILTPYTSYLVLEDNAAIPGPRLRQALGPMDDMGGRFEEERDRFSPQSLKSESTGANAFDSAVEMKAMRESAAPAPSMSAGGGFSGRLRGSSASDKMLSKLVTRDIEDRTFYLIDGRWEDSRIKESKADVTVKAYSSAYFELIKRFPEVRKFLALGEKVLVAVGEKVVEISPDSGISEASELKL